MAIKEIRVRCYRCKRTFLIQVPTWLTEMDTITCGHCGEEIRIYPLNPHVEKYGFKKSL